MIGSKTTIRITRTAPLVTCHQRCSVRKDRYLKHTCGTGLQDQDYDAFDYIEVFNNRT
jgi:hypothetical protein